MDMRPGYYRSLPQYLSVFKLILLFITLLPRYYKIYKRQVIKMRLTTNVFHKRISNHHPFLLSTLLVYHLIYDILDDLFFFLLLFLLYRFHISWKDLALVMSKYNFNIYITSDIRADPNRIVLQIMKVPLFLIV